MSDVLVQLRRIADALERLAGPERPSAPERRAPREDDVDVSDTDRAAARSTARRLGLVVRERA